MRSALLRVLCLALVCLVASGSLGQQPFPRPLITQPINEGQLVTLRGNTHPLAQPQFDIGPAPQNLSLQRMLLVLKRGPQQEFALHKLLDDQQDKNSPNYHKWLTPDEFGLQFGPSDQDVQLVSGWLMTHGFQVNRISHGRTVIEFSGFEAQVEQAFRAQIRQYSVNGQLHWANATDPQIPAALAPAVAGVWSLHDFRKKPHSRILPDQFAVQVGSVPLLTFQGKHALMPADYAIIYNINPLYSAGINGQGTKVAVVARSNINTSDLFSFWSFSGLPGFPFLNIINDGPDPGIFDPNEEFEADLDASWSGAIAYGAQVNFVVSASTNTTDGVDLSELYIIDSNIADVMTESFGSCEGFATQAEANAISSLAQQAAAEGISYMVSSGDAGAETCVDPNLNSAGGAPPSVNVLASSAFTTAVGGTIFNDTSNSSKYWNSSSTQNNQSSAKSYITENVWNESCSSCGLWAGGGGTSTFFSKPNWQSGVSGIPNDGARDLPDVSLTAALHDPYLLCFELSCSQGGSLYGVGGTSASAPSFAGIIALVVQKYGRQGQANYILYRLAAAQTLSQCNGSNTTTPPASTCIFNDITKGNNAVPGEPGYGTASAQYQATTGFDLATGLGSVNVANLVNKWNTVTFSATSTTLGPNSISATHGAPVTLNASVSPNSGTGVPTGDVSLQTDFSPGSLLINAGSLRLTNGSVSAQVNDLPGGNYNIAARYAGDGTFAPSTSNQIPVSISAENSITTVSILTASAIPFTNGPYGGFTYPRADVSGVSGHGAPTGLVYFYDNGNQYSGPMSLNVGGNTGFPNGTYFFSPGQHALTAFYIGDISFNQSTSAAVNFTITKANTSTAISPSLASAAQGTPIAIVANISTPAFATYSGLLSTVPYFPSGSVSFFNGSTQIGTAQAFAQLQTPAGLTAIATLNTSNLPVGPNTIIAKYSGDGNYIASSAAPVTITIAADFTFSAGSSSITVTKPGGSASNTLTITGQTGYNGTINFTSASCSGLPSRSTCQFSPASVGGSGNSTVTILTTAPSASLLVPWTGTGIFFAGVLMLATPLRRRRIPVVLGVLLFTVALGNIACGGGSGGGGGGGGGNPGTPIGNYNVVVTATTSDGVVSHNAGFTLVVN